MTDVAGASRADGRRRARSLGIDVVKGLAILGVIAQHVLPSDEKLTFWGPLWFEQAVPVFVLLMAYNAARGFARSAPRSLGGMYGQGYLRSRLRRLVLPLVPVWIAMIVVALLQGRLKIGPLQFLAAAPIDGGAPGDYFVLLVLLLAAILPGLWWCFERSPSRTVVVVAAATLVSELVARRALGGSPAAGYLAVANPLHFGPALLVGFWLATQPSLGSVLRRRDALLLGGAAVSFAYLLLVTFTDPRYGRNGFGVLFPGFTTSTGVWALGWTTLVTLVLVSRIDAAGEAARRLLAPLAELGKASYHVFLVQMAIIGLWQTDDAALLVAEAIGSLLVGWAFWQAMERPARAPRARLRAA